MGKRGLVIVANFNQRSEIPEVLADLPRFHPKEDVLIVDDGSTDGSAEFAQSQGFNVLRAERNLGLGATIRRGLQFAVQSAVYEYVVIMAANGKMKAAEMDRLKAPILAESADYVQGSRYIGGTRSPALPSFRRFAIPIVTASVNWLLGTRISDLMCGYRAYSLKILNDDRINLHQSWLDQRELEFYLHYLVCSLGYRVVEVPVTMDYSHLARSRRSHIIPFLDWWRIIRPFILLSLRLRK